MPTSPAAYVQSPASRRVAEELQALRKSRGLSGEAVAARLNWSPSKVSRYEGGRTGAKPSEVKKLLGVYKPPAAQAEALYALAVRAWEERKAEEPGRFDTAEVLAWAPASLPLLLRTDEYHTAVLTTVQRVLMSSPGTIREEVNRNILWRARLLAEESPLAVRAVLDESVLTRQFGTPKVMQAQVAHLISLAAKPHVDILVLPHRAGGPSWLPPFTYTRFTAGEGGMAAAPDEMAVPALTGVWTADSDRTTWPYQLAFTELADRAEPPADFLKQAQAGWAA